MAESTELQLFKVLEALKRFDNPFTIANACFDKQIEFITHPARFKTACCGGRAGKTVADAVYLHHAALSKPGGVALYITLSRSNAKKLIWPELLRINREFNLGGKVNEADLSIKHTNNTFIYASGASHTDEIEKFRGLPLIICIIDEVQSFKSFIKSLIDDVVSKRLFDFGGTLALTGTPGPVPSGYFFDACHNPAYAHFHWTMFDNPWISKKSDKTHQELLDEELARKGVTIEDPSIQREVFGKWVLHIEALVFKYKKAINDYQSIPSGKYNYILGIDVGFDDSDALAVIGWTDTERTTYLFEEVVTAKQGITELVTQIEALQKKYDISKIVMDMGGLGKKIAEEIIRRYKIPVMAAEKSRKFENIELFNDDLRTGRFKAQPDSNFASDCMLMEWDKDKSTPDRMVVSDKFHSDICDAVLYAWRESYAFTSEALTPKHKWGTKAWADEEAERMEEDAMEYFKRQEQDINGHSLIGE